MHLRSIVETSAFKRLVDLKLGLPRSMAMPALGVVAGLLAFAPAANANLLTNSDFNDTTSATSSNPNGWGSYAADISSGATGGAFTSYKYPGDGTATDGTASDANAYDGTPYVAFGNYNYTNGFGTQYSGYNQTVAGAPGVMYTATIESATSNYGYPDAEFHLIYLDASGTILRTDAITIDHYANAITGNGAFSKPYTLYSLNDDANTSTSSEYTGSTTATYSDNADTSPSPAGTAFVKFEISLDNGVGTIYVDDASLTVVPEPASLGMVAIGASTLLRRRRSR